MIERINQLPVSGITKDEKTRLSQSVAEGRLTAADQIKMLTIEAKALRETVRAGEPLQVSATAEEMKARSGLASEIEGNQRKIAKLTNQMEAAVKLYTDIFAKYKTNLTGANLLDGKSPIEQLPMTVLTPEERVLATQLLQVIHENESLIYMKQQGFDTRFMVPQDAVRPFAGMAKETRSGKESAKAMLTSQLSQLIPDAKIGQGNARELIKTHIAGLLADRPDIRIAFSLLNPTEKEKIIGEWLQGKIEPSQLGELQNEVLRIINDSLPSDSTITITTNKGKPIGTGAFGKVSEGTFIDKIVVIKEIESGAIDDAFIVEALRQSEMRYNPHVPKIAGVYMSRDSEPHPMVVMEKVEGGNYMDLLGIDKGIGSPLNVGQRAKVAVHCISGMAKGLEPLHQHGLVHCDLKPANVMLDPKTLEPRLIDFGECSKAGERAPPLGTPITRSPEVAKGYKGPGPQLASDVYALGCIMYQEITGKIDISTDTRGNVKPDLDKLNGQEWNDSPLSECKPFIKACLNLDPNKRPTLQQILQAVRGEPITPGAGTQASPGLTEAEIRDHTLDVLKPEKGYARDAKELLINLLPPALRLRGSAD